QLLSSRFPTYELISDIGSGINFKRKGLQTLLEQSCKGLVGEIVVTHRDRLCRFAYELLKYMFLLNSTKLVALFDDSTTDEHELSEDILAIFICRVQGRRSAKNRRERKEKKESFNSEKKQNQVEVQDQERFKTYYHHTRTKFLKKNIGINS